MSAEATVITVLAVVVFVIPVVAPALVQAVAAIVSVDAAVTTYPVIADPPVVAGAVHETVTLLLPAIAAVTPVGAPGTLSTVTAAEGFPVEATTVLPSPRPIAETVTEYVLPGMNPNELAVWSTPEENDCPSACIVLYRFVELAQSIVKVEAEIKYLFAAEAEGAQLKGI